MRVTVEANGARITGWRSVILVHAFDAISGSFKLSTNDSWSDNVPAARIMPMDPVRIFAGTQEVITGRAETRDVSLTEESYETSITGRDLSGWLLEAELTRGWQVTGGTAAKFLTDVTRGHGLPVKLVGTFPAMAQFSAEAGETLFTVIDRCARSLGAVARFDGSSIVLKRPEFRHSGRIDKFRGYSVRASVTDRFGAYVAAYRGAKTGDKPSVVRELDDQVHESRTKVLRADGCRTRDLLTQRARWERNVRAARSVEINVSLNGWGPSDDAIWRVGDVARVVLPRENIDADLVISRATFTASNTAGPACDLTLLPDGAFTPDPIDVGSMMGK